MTCATCSAVNDLPAAAASEMTCFASMAFNW
jgi:hypothetical protein